MSIDRARVDKAWSVRTVEYYSAMKRDKGPTHTTTWTHAGDVTLGEEAGHGRTRRTIPPARGTWRGGARNRGRAGAGGGDAGGRHLTGTLSAWEDENVLGVGGGDSPQTALSKRVEAQEGEFRGGRLSGGELKFVKPRDRFSSFTVFSRPFPLPEAGVSCVHDGRGERERKGEREGGMDVGADYFTAFTF